MARCDDVWFVQMRNVGTFLGPMPWDALTEMARTGALLRDDLVRCDDSAAWRSASELSELADAFAGAATSVSGGVVISSSIGLIHEENSVESPNSVALFQPAMPPALSIAEDDPAAILAASPSADVIVFAVEPRSPPEPASEERSEFDFEVAQTASLATSETASHNTEMPMSSSSMLVDAESASTPETFVTADSTSANDGFEESLSESAPLLPSIPTFAPTFRTTKKRGPSMLSRFGHAVSEFPTRLNSPIDKRLVLGLVVVASLGWYFYPSRRPARRAPVQTAEVAGTVRLNGKPISNVLVVFRPDRSQGTIGPPSIGQTDAEGHFKLTSNTRPGAVVGKHQVTVLSRDSAANLASSPNTVAVTAPGSIPPRYSEPETSRLAAEILPGQLNEIALDLTSN